MYIRRIISIVFFIFLCGNLFSQITPKGTFAVHDSITVFGSNISIGNTIFNDDNQRYYVVISGILSSETLVTAAAKVKELAGGISGNIPDAIISFFGKTIDSSYCQTTIKALIGYSEGFVVDTIIYMTYCRPGSVVDVTPKIMWGPDMDATGTALITTPDPVTSHTSPTKVSTFNNGTIPRGNMLWLTFSSITTRSKTFMVQIIGHRL